MILAKFKISLSLMGYSQMDDNKLLNQAIHDMFQKHDLELNTVKKGIGFKKNKKGPKNELELAMAIILVDLASCDNNFDQREYQVITRGLNRLFGTNKCDVEKLVQQAQTVVDGLRGTANFAKLLKDNLKDEEKDVVLELIDELIDADGVEDGFETYLRHKYSDLLGMPQRKRPDNVE